MVIHRLVRAVRSGCAAALCLLTPAICLAQQAEATVKDLPPMPSLGNETLKVAGVLCLMLAFIFAGFWVLKRYGHRAGLGVLTRNELKLEGHLALGPKKQIVVVRFLNKRMVLGVTETSINLLTETESKHDDDSQADFTKSLDKARTEDGTS